ncbi:MAG: copper chaperone PCu(A)C [Reyranella sp.]|uniref:copper chaperone PCu(A)C n=1 Tax=Reyranella sp. TaxID=1929291 RepID=UPI003D1264D8
MSITRTVLAGLLSLLAVAAEAADYKLGAIEIKQPWTRATPPSAPAGGGYLVLTNTGTTPDRLVAVTSPSAGKVELHEMSMEGSIMRMRELPKGVELPPGATVTLKPGGLHLMFMDLKAPFAKDTKVPATLVFEKAGSIPVELTVEAMGASAPGQHGR